MLYLSTRNKNDIQTAYKAIHNDRCTDDGLYVPFHLPVYTEAEITQLAENSFSTNVAQIINLFFGAGLSGWDVDFLLGRNCARLNTMKHHVLVGELWRNPEGDFSYFVQALSRRIRKENPAAAPTQWVTVAVRIAAIFGIYGMLLAENAVTAGETIDVAVPTNDFAMPMAAWYARKMGLPIGNIICGCNENGALWDLVNLGELPTGNTVVKTATPLSDMAVPTGIEQWIYECLSPEEVCRYAQALSRGRTYFPPEEEKMIWGEGTFAAVISVSRVHSLIHNVFRNSDLIIGPYDTLAYGSLLDYRAKTGQGGTAILLSERSPACDSEVVATALKMNVTELQKRLQDC